MLKLYKAINEELHYHEAWESAGTITEHWGKVGDTGESRSLSAANNTIESVLSSALEDGYEPMEPECVLLVEYAVEGMGTTTDLDKRHALENEMNELLGWTGLGHCDGGSMGSGTMEVCCFVIDFTIAERVIAEKLRGTPFGNFTRIFEE